MTGPEDRRIISQEEISWESVQRCAQSHETHTSSWCLVSQHPNLKQQNTPIAEGHHCLQ